jgi:hypothetical protein
MIRNCRNPLMPLRVRRQMIAHSLDKQWRELCKFATIEKDPEKLSQLAAQLEKRRRAPEVPQCTMELPVNVTLGKNQ